MATNMVARGLASLWRPYKFSQHSQKPREGQSGFLLKRLLMRISDNAYVHSLAGPPILFGADLYAEVISERLNYYDKCSIIKHSDIFASTTIRRALRPWIGIAGPVSN